MNKPLLPCHIFCESVPEGSVLSFIRSLGKRNVPIYLYLLDDPKGLRPVYSHSRFCKQVKVVNEENFRDAFVNGNKNTDKSILLPFTDRTSALIAKNRQFFDERFVVMQAKTDIITTMLDKVKADSMAKYCGLLVPSTFLITIFEDLMNVSQQVSFPVILKPKWFKTNNSTGFKAIIVRSKQEMLETGRDLLEDGTVFIVQEYIEGNDECVEFFLFYRSKEGKVFSCSGRKVLQYPERRGIMAIGYTTKDNFLEKKCVKFLKDINYIGFGGLEFKLWQGKRYFIEMSVRPEGFSHITISSGLDLPWIGYSDVAGLRQERPFHQARIVYYFNPFCCWGLIMTGQKKIHHCIHLSIFLINKKALTDIFCLNDMMPLGILFLTLLKRKLKSCFQFDKG